MLSTNQEPVVGCTSYSPLPAKRTRYNTQIDFSQRTVPSLNLDQHKDQELLSKGFYTKILNFFLNLTLNLTLKIKRGTIR